MANKEDKDTRYYIDLDLKTNQILGWDFDNRHILIKQALDQPHYHRIFLTKGQYNKLVRHQMELDNHKIYRAETNDNKWFYP